MDIYDYENYDIMIDDDEMTVEEALFMQGYLGI